MKKLKFYIAFFLFFVLQKGNAQDAKISITSNSGHFFVLMNNVIQNPSPKDSIHISSLSEGSYNLKLINTDSIVSVDKTIFINSNQHVQYEHSVEDSIAFLRLIGNYTEVIPDSTYLKFSTTITTPVDSIFQYTTDSLKLHSLLYSNNYKGKTGCQTPNLINTQRIIQEINKQMLTRKKREVILSELKNQCIQVKTLHIILETIEYEDSKLNIIKLLSDSIYDIENLDKLDTLFNIRGYQDAFNDLKQSL